MQFRTGTGQQQATSSRRKYNAVVLAVLVAFSVSLGVGTETAFATGFTPAAPSIYPYFDKDPTNQTTQYFLLTGDDGVTFNCSLDGAAYAVCDGYTWIAVTGLADGQHTFSAQAIDMNGTPSDASSVTWTVDTTAPAKPSSFTGVPSQPTRSTSATIGFTLAEEGGTVECSPDGQGWGPCTSVSGTTGSETMADLAEGNHFLFIRQTDAAGNEGEVAIANWTVDLTGPNAPGPFWDIPSSPTASRSATISFYFDASSGGTVECRLDAGSWESCTSASGGIATYALTAIPGGTHTISARQTDVAGNTGSVGTSDPWTIDLTPPTTPGSFTGVPSGSTNIRTATIGFTLGESGGTVECRLNSGTWGACTSISGTSGTYSLSALTAGAKTISVRQTDSVGNVSAIGTSSSWTVDLTAPSSPGAISGVPSSPTKNTGATLTFTTAESGGTIQCKLDSGSWNACTSFSGTSGTFVLSGLADGAHTAYVRQTDAAGNVSATRTSTSWTVDATAPAAAGSFSGTPSSPTTSTNQSVSFTLAESGGTAQCRLDSGSWVSCSSISGRNGSFNVSGLSEGTHTVSVRQTDAAGNVGAIGTSSSWTVDRTAPSAPGSFTGVASAVTNATTATVGFTLAEAVSDGRVECTLDSGDWVDCTSGVTGTSGSYVVTDLIDGTHDVSVRQIDAAGNVSSTSTTNTWTVDATPPLVPSSLTGVPYSPTRGTTATISFTLAEAVDGGKVECRLDSGTWADCTSRVSGTSGSYAVTGLADGSHSVSVRQTDAAGSPSTVATTTSWTVDSTSTTPEFLATGSMAAVRAFHTSTTLANGKVLITGGYSVSGPTRNTELYDPAAGTFSASGLMTVARQQHTATLLPNGKVLIAGGVSASSTLSSAELYDPSTGTFTATGTMSSARSQHTATLLSNGKVLFTGGSNGSGPVASAELYDPSTGTFTATGSMAAARLAHTATLLADGNLLVTGGSNNSGVLSSAELYNPATGTFTTTGTMRSPRLGHSETLLLDGKVLFTGGNNGSRNLATAEVFNPATGTFTATGTMTSARGGHTATFLSGGMVLIAGGSNGASNLSSAELYNPATGLFAATRGMTSPRITQSATLLSNGNLLVSGGNGGGASVEIYYADLPPTAPGSFTGVPSAATTSTSATIGFTLGEAVAGGKVECRLDGGAWVDCTSSVTGTTGSYALSGLADGNHTVSARQTDAAGNVSNIGSSTSWTVDSSAPSAPTLSDAPNGTTSTTSATLTFSGDSDSAFTCSIDGGEYSTCISPLSLTDLADGNHSVSIKSRDAAGNLSAATSASWTVDTSAPSEPTLSEGPTGFTTSASATLTFSGDEDATLTCSIDDGEYENCSSPLSLHDLRDGDHSVRIKSRDAAGNTSSVRTVSWTVITAAPATPTFTGAPTGAINGRHVLFSFTGDMYTTFTCSIDAGAYNSCTSPLELDGLSDGAHSVRVKATDRVGNSSIRLASWTVDTTAPNTPTMGGVPSALTNLRNVTLSFTSDSDSTLTCSIDAGSYNTCTSPLSLTGLAEGTHSVSVKATDGAGNVSSVRTSSWRVDTTAPPVVTVNGLPSGTTVSPNATARFSSIETGVTFECRLNLSGPINACTSPWELRGLGAGTYTAYVRTKDAAGNTSAWTSKSWTVRQPCPTPTIVNSTFHDRGHGQLEIKPGASANDVRPACQLLTVQIWDGPTRPSGSEHLTDTPSFSMRIIKYGKLVRFDGAKTFVPRWIRVENKVGTWSVWYQLRKTVFF